MSTPSVIQTSGTAVVVASKASSTTLDQVVNERVLSFLGNADVLSLGVSNALYRNLTYAYRGMSYVKAQHIVVDNQVKFTATGETREEAGEATERMRRQIDFATQVKPEFYADTNLPWLTPEIGNEPNLALRTLKIVAAAAKHEKRGRCEEVSAMALVHIHEKVSQNVTLSRYTLQRSDYDVGHVGIVVGETSKNSAILLDTWAQKLYLYHERSNHVESYLGTHANGTPILKKYDENRDEERVEVVCTALLPRSLSPASPTVSIQEEESPKTDG